MSTLQNALNEINGEFRGANYISLQGDLRVLEVALKQYNLLFNNLFKDNEKLQKNVGKLVSEIPTLPEDIRRNKIKNLQLISNIVANRNDIATAKNKLEKATDAEEQAKQIKIIEAKINNILEKITNTIKFLIDAFTSVRKDIFRLGADRLYTPSGVIDRALTSIGKESPQVTKFKKLYELLHNIITSLELQMSQFIKLKQELRTAVVSANAKRSASQLQARLNSLRGIVSIGVPGLSAENQRKGVISAVNKIQRKIGGGTRKRHHSRKRHTRRN